MNTNLMKITAFLALPIVALSCSEKTGGQDGYAAFSLTSDGIVAEVTRSNVSDYAALPSADAFRLQVSDARGTSVYAGLLKDYDASTPLKAGNYSVTAACGSSSEEGFGKPYFSGRSDFGIAGGDSKVVKIRATLANSIVRFAFTDTFKSYYPDYSFTLTTGGGTAIDFPKGETRAAFIDAYKFSVSGTLTNQGGKSLAFNKSYDKSIEAGKCYVLKFDVSNVGGAAISISFDDNVEDVALSEIELND